MNEIRKRAMVHGSVWLALCLSTACADDGGMLYGMPAPGSHGGTETGNPPVIDSQRIALVVRADGLSVSGSAGAVTPGGTALEVEALSTMRVFTGTAERDGAFEIAVEGPLAETFAVRAVGAAASAPVVYVLRGGASVTTAEGGTLSCNERMGLAQTQMLGASQAADKQCASHVDCVTVSYGTLCSGDCSSAYVSNAGAAQLDEARDAVEGGLCASFESDGCQFLVPPCVPPEPGAVKCVSGSCEFVLGATATDCTSAFDAGPTFAFVPVYWFDAASDSCVQRTYGGSGGNGNRYATQAECQAACAPAGSDPVCPPNRRYTEVCLSGGLAGGCGTTGMACALICTSASDCAGDSVGTWCNSDGVCDATNPD